MKLRLRKNSIRIRLLQTEVQTLKASGSISETVAFGLNADENLVYSLSVTEDAEKISARFDGNKIEIILPFEQTKSWIETDEVGLSEKQKIGDSNELFITIEKDFVCLDRPDDLDNKDAFPHLKTKC